jgi:hypothetical protein
MIINCRCHLTIVALDAAAVSDNIRYPMIDLLKASQTSRVWILIKMSSLRIFFLPPLYEMPNDFVFETTGILPFFIAALRFCYLRLVFKMYLRDTRLFKTDFSLESKQTNQMEQLVIARPTGIKLRKTLKGDMIKQVEINTLKKGITLFHWLQLSLVLIIFSLSIFGFN